MIAPVIGHIVIMLKPMAELRRGQPEAKLAVRGGWGWGGHGQKRSLVTVTYLREKDLRGESEFSVPLPQAVHTTGAVTGPT